MVEKLQLRKLWLDNVSRLNKVIVWLVDANRINS